MAINFPNTPILNQTFSSGNNTYIWNGSAWVGYSTVTSGGGGVTVSSQWVTESAGIHTSSNVGIGTTNPTQSLTVNGVIRAGVSTFYTFQSSGGFTGDGSEGRYLQLGYQTNPNYILNNIGIGTTNAASKLTVQGTLSVSGVSTFQNGYKVTGGNSYYSDDVRLYFGNDSDIFIGHQTIPSPINYIAGDNNIPLTIWSDNLTLGAQNGENFATFITNGSASLYHDNSKKFETTGAGVVVTGIVTATSFVGDGSQLTGISGSGGTLGVGTFYASIGVTTTIHTLSNSNVVSEYTLFFQYNSTIQSQKVMVMNNGSTAYAQEYAIMYEPSQIVSVGATVSGSNVLLQVTPKSGITGITTFKYLLQVVS